MKTDINQSDWISISCAKRNSLVCNGGHVEAVCYHTFAGWLIVPFPVPSM